MTLSPNPSPSTAESRRVLARRLEAGELKGTFGRSLEVPFGQRGVLFESGRYVATLPSGRHAMEGWRRAEGFNAILVEDDTFPLVLVSEDLRSSEGHRLRVAVELGLRLTTPEVFVRARVRERSVYRVDDLRDEIGAESLRAIEAVVTHREVGELTHRSLGQRQLELDLLNALQPICDRSGLLLERLVGLRVEAPDLAEAVRLRAEYEERVIRMQGNRALLEERLRRERLELDHEIGARRKVAEQRIEERRQWFEQQRIEQSFAREEQMKKLWEMARIHEMQKEKRAEERRQDQRLSAEIEEKRNSLYSGLSPEQILTLTIANHPERASELSQALEAVRGGGRSKDPYESARPMPPTSSASREEAVPAVAPVTQWSFCRQHRIRFNPVEGPCPLCGTSPGADS